MNADEHMRAGRVEEALQVLQEEVRSRPEDPKLRTFLFQLLAVMGQWDRAGTQLKLVADLEPSALLFSRVYQPLLQAELMRQDIFAGKTKPVIFGEPEPWMAAVLHGNTLAANGEYPAAQKCLQEALDAAPATAGTVNGLSCQWVRDADVS